MGKIMTRDNKRMTKSSKRKFLRKQSSYISRSSKNRTEKNKKRIILIAFSEKEKKELEKKLKDRFEIKEICEYYERNINVPTVLKENIVARGRAEFISKAQKLLGRWKVAALYNIMVRNFDILISFLGPEFQTKISTLILEKIIKLFRDKFLVGIISDRKFFVLKKLEESENGNQQEIEKEAIRYGDGLINEINSEKIDIEGKNVRPSTNIGVSLYPYHGENIAELLKGTEISLEESISKGTNMVEIFSEEYHPTLWSRTIVIEELLEGIKRGRIYPVFQPIFSVEDMRVRGYELLLRWKEKQISPEKLIKISWEMGLIGEVNEFLFEKLAEFLKVIPKSFVSFNISPQFLIEDRFLKTKREIIDRYKIENSRICFEISEKSSAKEIEKVKWRIEGLKKEGFLFALDDFGSPETIIMHIRDIPLDIVKIDRRVTKGIVQGDEFFKLIANGIVHISRKLGRKVLAEGIETKEELEAVIKLGVDMVQGFLLSPPLTEEEILFGKY